MINKLKQIKIYIGQSNDAEALKQLSEIIDKLNNATFEHKYIILKADFNDLNSEAYSINEKRQFRNELLKLLEEIEQSFDEASVSTEEVSTMSHQNSNASHPQKKRVWIWLFALVFIVIITTIVANYYIFSSKKRLVTITGVVTNNQQKLLVNAQVKIDSGKTLFTDSLGRFSTKINVQNGMLINITVANRSYPETNYVESINLREGQQKITLRPLILSKKQRIEIRALNLNTATKAGYDITKTLKNLPSFTARDALNPSAEIVYHVVPYHLRFFPKTIKPKLNLSKLQLGGKTVFHNLTLKQNARFFHTKFLDRTTFNRVHFDSVALFNQAEFYQEAFFTKCRFKDSISDFRRVVFDGLVQFDDTEFVKKANFGYANFRNITSFNQVKFKGDVSFDDAQFGRVLYLNGADFAKTASFKNAVMPDTLYLNNVSLTKELDLSQVRLHSKQVCRINLANTNIDKIRLHYTQFELFFPDSFVQQPEKKIEIYDRLLNKLKKDGMIESAKKLDIEYRKFKNAQRGWIGVVENIINEQWWNFGYGRDRILLNTLWLVLFFGGINFVFFHTLLHKVYLIPKIDNKHQAILWNNQWGVYYSSFQTPARKKIRNMRVQLALIYISLAYLIISLFFLPFLWAIITDIIPLTVLFLLTSPLSILRNEGQTREERLKRFRYIYSRLFLSLFYTGYIFFGLKVETEYLRYEGLFWPLRLTYFFVIYLAGLASLAYLVGYVVVS